MTLIFRIITGISVLGMIFMLSLHRFRNTLDASKKGSDKSSSATYIPWLFRQTFVLLKTAGVRGWRERYHRWIVLRHSRRERWIIICLAISFCFLAASGFLFPVLSSLRLYGFILLLHVTVGGFFAVCLALATVMRARHYRLEAENISRDKNAQASGGKSTLQISWQTIFFWICVASGLCLIVSALTLMLSYITVSSQLDMFEVHRYSALISLLSAMAFAYFSLLDARK
jgi:hypothetical protein